MAVIERNQVKAPVLRKQTVSVPALGGDVIVRGLLLSEMMVKNHVNAENQVPRAGETEQQARARAGARAVSFTLANTVTAADGKALFTEEEWDVFGAEHTDAVIELFKVAETLNGLNKKAVEKN